MIELESQGYPFQPNGKVLIETRHRLVVGLEPSSVIKVSKVKSDREIFPSVDAALSEIEENNDSRRKITDMLASLGAERKIVVPTQTVIHSAPYGSGITYTEVQRWHKDATPIADLGKKLFNLPIHAINDLKSLFKVNMQLLKEERTCFEFDGTSEPIPPTTREKILHNLFPLLYAHNILIEPDGTPQLVDVESLEKFSRFTRVGFKGWARRQVKKVGFHISTGILDGIMLVKKFTRS